MDSKKDILWRVYLVYLLMLLFGLAIIAKMVFIQVKEGPELAKKAQKQEIRVFNLKAARGNVLSDQGDLLATTVPVFEVRMDVANDYIPDALFKDKVDSLAYRLSKLFGDRSQKEYERMLVKARKTGNRFLLIRRHVTYEQLKEIRTFPILRRGRNRGGLITFQKMRRELPYGMLAARTIGYTIPDEKIYVGLEGAYSKVLSGVDGKQIRRRINHGAWLPVHTENETQPQNGKDIVTTIDVNLQDVAEEALRDQLIKHKARMGCAVLMKVKTGDIKAIANLSYNSETGKYDESYNMAIGEKYEPGSTFKLASMIAALQDHKVKLTDTVNVKHGYVVYYGRTLRDVHTIGDGMITIAQAFEHSSNVGISKMIYHIYKNDPDKYINHLYKLKLNKKLGLKIPGEAQPYIKNPSDKKHWYLTSLPWMSVGYGLELTPLQILAFYNGVANNGVEVKPRFVKEIMEGGTVVKKFPVKVINPKMASPHTIKLLKELLRGVVERGTAQNLKNDHFGIAGKTGTAKISENGRYIPAYNASFVGYFPADDPQYSCIVVINRPRNGYYGSSAAAPVFEEIARKVYATSLSLSKDADSIPAAKSLPQAYVPAWYPDMKTLYKDFKIPNKDYLKNENWTVVINKNDTAEFNARDFAKHTVPNVKGMKAKDALYLLESMGLEVSVSGKGSVYAQSIRPGTYFKKGNHITIKLSTY